MLKPILDFSISNRKWILTLAVLLTVLGIFRAMKLPVDAVPDVTSPQVQINAEVEALSPEEIERLVTIPLENALMGLPDALECRSLSKLGLSQITLIFKDHSSVQEHRIRVNERIAEILPNLPNGISPRMGPVTTGLGDIYYYALGLSNDRELNPAILADLRTVHDTVVRPRLRTVAGVADVNPCGGYERQWVLEPDMAAMAALGIGMESLVQTLQANFQMIGGGAIERSGERITVRPYGNLQSPDEVMALPVRRGFGAEGPKVRDVAKIREGSAIRYGASTVSGQEAMVGSVMMRSGENSRVTSQRIRKALEQIQRDLPAEYRLVTLYDRSELVDRTLRTVALNLSEGAILVVFVLFLLMGEIRAAIIVSLAVPLSFLFSLVGLAETRTTGNLMSLGAVDFGLLVDGAVVMVENMLHRLRERAKLEGRPLSFSERLEVIRHGAHEVSRPTLFGVAIITVVYVPIFFLTGIEGKMFRPMAMAVVLALTGSLILTFTVIPALAASWLRPDTHKKENRLLGAIGRLYRPLLRWSLSHRLVVTAAILVLLGSSLWVFSRMGAVFIPRLDEGSFAVHMIRTPSIAIAQSLELQETSEKSLLEHFAEIDSIFARLGTPEIATDPMGLNVSDTYIFLKPRNQWRKIDGHRATKEELANLMSESLAIHVPGQATLFSQPIEMRFNELLEGTRADLAVKISGQDFDELERLAKEVRKILEQTPGAADIEFDAIGKNPTLEIRPRAQALAEYGMNRQEVIHTVGTALAGEQVGILYRNQRAVPVVVRLPDRERNRQGNLKGLPVATPDGGLVPLGNLVDFVPSEQVGSIVREDGARRVAIMVNLRGRDVESFVREAESKIREEVPFPSGYVLSFGGQYENLVEARRRLAIIIPAALLVILLLIQWTFGNWRQTLLVFTGIPLALTGGIFALALRDMPFSISAAVGFIALSGIAVLNGLMLISAFNQSQREGGSPLERAERSALRRLPPVLMTALVAGLGFVPMALATGAGADVQKPLATVVIGGILSSTLLTLLLLPTWAPWARSRKEDAPTQPLQA